MRRTDSAWRVPSSLSGAQHRGLAPSWCSHDAADRVAKAVSDGFALVEAGETGIRCGSCRTRGTTISVSSDPTFLCSRFTTSALLGFLQTRQPRLQEGFRVEASSTLFRKVLALACTATGHGVFPRSDHQQQHLTPSASDGSSAPSPTHAHDGTQHTSTLTEQ